MAITTAGSQTSPPIPDPAPYIGLNFGQPVLITNVAWSRDNGNTATDACGGTCVDRGLGVYTLQVTLAENPGVGTPETGDAATGWATIGTVEYRRDADPPDFRSWMRHRFEVSAGGAPIEATGLRIKVPLNTMCLDELEVNTAAARPDPEIFIARGSGTVIVSWTGGGGLEGAEKVTGPWSCIQEARTPYVVQLGTTPMRFFRVRR